MMPKGVPGPAEFAHAPGRALRPVWGVAVGVGLFHQLAQALSHHGFGRIVGQANADIGGHEIEGEVGFCSRLPS